MQRIKPRTLSGFMELLPDKQAKMERMTQILRESYAVFGYTPLDTPIIEAAEVLLAKGGGETEKQIYRFSKGDGDLALRFDLTVPLAKYVALNYGRLSFPFRRYQIGKVYRGERAQKGRFREFYQADIDIIGDGKLDVINEAEIPAVIYGVFFRLGLSRFKIHVSNRKILTGFCDILGISEISGEVMRIIDKLDKTGHEAAYDMLAQIGVSSDITSALLDFISVSGDSAAKMAALEAYRGKNQRFDEGLFELSELVKYLPAFGVPDANFEIDLGIARGLDYYTGTVYETVLTDYPEIGSVCSGGRYDDLAEYYSDKKLPGVGISIGLTRLFAALDSKELLSDEIITSPCDVLILPMTEDLTAAVSAATYLRQKGIRVMLHCEDKKMGAKLGYADKQHIPFAMIIGEDEIKSGLVSLKNLSSGEQISLTTEGAAGEVLKLLSERLGAKVIKERD